MKRRTFIAGIGTAAAWPVVVRGQQGGRLRRIGVLLNTAADDPVSNARVTAFVQALEALGWVDGRNVRIDYRWSAGEPERSTPC
jgi:putative ABC transport system substrate-binding protein